MEQVTPSACEAHRQIMDERFDRDYRRLNNLEKRQDYEVDRRQEIEKLNVQMGEILKNQSNKLDNHDGRITTLEHRPGSLWDKVSMAAITAIVGALVGAAATLIFK